jgi:tRNA (cmo5U34)-methyltransferase
MNKQKAIFSFDTIDEFDKHIATSVSNYESIEPLINSLAEHFVEPDDNIYDLGCSTGGTLYGLSLHGTCEGVSYVGYDISDNLLPTENIPTNMAFFKRDITDPKIKFFNTSFIMSIFTLQFIPREKRETLVQKVYHSLNPGGAFIVCEKIYMANGMYQSMFNSSHYDYKLRTYTAEEILDKQNTLRTIMRPLSDYSNIEMFRNAGFKVETFWQSLNFKGYLVIK